MFNYLSKLVLEVLILRMEIINKLSNNINNYFIDNDITIKKDDDIQIKFNKYLLKYKKIIALICLIILLIIGYYCNPFNIENENKNKNQNRINNNKNNNIHLGGGKIGDALKAAKAKASSAINAKGIKSEAKLAIVGDKVSEAKDKAKESLKEGASKVVSPTTYYNAGAAAAHKFKDNAGIIYQILYSIALFMVLCVITVPAMIFIVIGIMCFFLLKDKMKTIKGL